jgi:chemotaxis protein CheD
MTAWPSDLDASPSASERPASDGACERAYLHAGQVVVSERPCIITTIVGSCVAVYLFDPVRRAGGGNHYVLPAAGALRHASPRFGDVAIPELITRMLSLGCREGDLQAKVFGGASILQSSERAGVESLGMKNVRLARQLLYGRRISVLAEDAGGTRGRKIVFRTDTGDVWVRKL